MTKNIIRYNATSTNFYSLTDQANFTIYYISYNTLVAISNYGKLEILKNQWGTTTGKHLNYLDSNKKVRVDKLTLTDIDKQNLKAKGINF